jgi:hypothetical protein
MECFRVVLLDNLSQKFDKFDLQNSTCGAVDRPLVSVDADQA